MRLVCPNCGAQYEVSAEAIPPGGRDVQCSACGHTWFEGPPGTAPGHEPPDRSQPDAFVEDLGVEAPVVEGDDEEADDLAELEWDEAPLDPPAAGPAPRSTVSPEVAEILRAEALREAAVREEEARHDPAGLPWSPDEPAPDEPAPDDLAADIGDGDPADGDPADPAREDPVDIWPANPAAEPDWPPLAAPAAAAGADHDRQRAEEARRRMARLRGETAPTTSAPVPQAPPARRDRLPDIEEISTSLRGTPPSRGAPSRASGPLAQARGGFRVGFGGVLLLAAALALLYVYAPRITAAAPATAAVLDPYVAAIDGGRGWLDRRLQGVLRDMTAAPAADAAMPLGTATEPPQAPAGPTPDAAPTLPAD